MSATEDNIPKGIAFAFTVTIVGSSAAAASKWIADEIPVPVIVMIQ